MTDIVGGLVKRRAELSGEADSIRARLAAIGTDLGHLDAVIRQFDPEHDIAGIRPKRIRGPDVAGRGEMSRFIMKALREATEPVATHEVVRRLMARAGRGRPQAREEHDEARGEGVQPTEGQRDGARDPGGRAGDAVGGRRVKVT